MNTPQYGTATEEKIAQVTEACERYGSTAIIALAGVPGTGKSYVASIAAQRFTDEPLLVREIQFHQSFSYEEFIEGMRIGGSGEVAVMPGVFLDWNERASDDPDHRYVLLIEELTRANIAAVLGELLTYIEYRDRPFFTVYSRRPVTVAKNLTLVAMYNPTDQSAIEVDAALLRRLRILRCPPSTEQLAEMLSATSLSANTVAALQDIFAKCHEKIGDAFAVEMPFGHGIFAGVENEKPDLHRLWFERIEPILRQPLREPHHLTAVIEAAYPWRDADYETS
jgi:5-methylcytosine-specific restriction protein B